MTFLLTLAILVTIATVVLLRQYVKGELEEYVC